jgi:hypothetical protein
VDKVSSQQPAQTRVLTPSQTHVYALRAVHHSALDLQYQASASLLCAGKCSYHNVVRHNAAYGASVVLRCLLLCCAVLQDRHVLCRHLCAVGHEAGLLRAVGAV